MALLTLRTSQWATSITTEMTFFVTCHTGDICPLNSLRDSCIGQLFLMIDAIYLFFATHRFQLNIYDLKGTSDFLEFRYC